ncbi:hypothetical protein [Paenibacillus alkalitolerans]|uniref:hypothetical protein n=1 Tax=Paenibacillus alkalitolerans TaxID=2799335 RepID=UPI0018F43C71|nr:hypothetical protein [Paenibacillus alkalitolerans]
MEEDRTQQGIENSEGTAEVSDLLSVPQGAKEYIDLIGDEDILDNPPPITQQ